MSRISLAARRRFCGKALVEFQFSPTAYELYRRNTAGNTIAETDGSGSTSNSSYNEYVFFEGRRIAQSSPSSGAINYYFVDHLGSTRVATPGPISSTLLLSMA